MSISENIWIFNITKKNWAQCVNGPTESDNFDDRFIGKPCQGVRPNSKVPATALEPGDLVLVRQTQADTTGVRGIWEYQDRIDISNHPNSSLWDDSEYHWILFCEPIQRELPNTFEEDWDKVREHLGLSSLQQATGKIQGAVSRVGPELSQYYLQGLLKHEGTNSAAQSRLEKAASSYNMTSLQDFSRDTEDESTQEQTWSPPQDTFETTDEPAELTDLYFSDDAVGVRPLTAQIDDALRSGKHIILTGPPGSGKTEIAKTVAEHYMGADYEMVTATDDWSTFDTIGGYRPTRNEGDSLKFTPGVFLQRFLNPEVPEAKNEWLIVDELNRANIDKAFGSLFSALTGNTVTLPFETAIGPITLVGDPASRATTPLTTRHYYIPNSWRLIGTMNTDDKASLYQMSYAFMRRFAFISVPVPDASAITPELVGEYMDLWGIEFDNDVRRDIMTLWQAVQRKRPIGPAIIKDILHQLKQQAPSDDLEYAYAMRMYVVPQLEGLNEDQIDDMLNQMEHGIDEFDRSLAERFIKDHL